MALASVDWPMLDVHSKTLRLPWRTLQSGALRFGHLLISQAFFSIRLVLIFETSDRSCRAFPCPDDCAGLEKPRFSAKQHSF